MATVSIRRESHLFARDVLFNVYVDGRQVATVSDGQQTSLTIESGHHRVSIGEEFARSDSIGVDVDPDVTMELICGTRITGWRVWLFPFISLMKGASLFIRAADTDTVVEIRQRGIDISGLRPLVPDRRQLGINLVVAVGGIALLILIVLSHRSL
jgi:hypothetical protein